MSDSGNEPGKPTLRRLMARIGWADAPFIIAMVLVAVPTLSTPSTLLDSNWVTGLQTARLVGMRFGPDIMFTYGPLSFLDSSSVFSAWMTASWLLAGSVSGWLLLVLMRRVLLLRMSALVAGLLLLVVVVPTLVVAGNFSTRCVLIAITAGFLGLIPHRRVGFTILLGSLAVLAAVTTIDKFANGILVFGFVALAAALRLDRLAIRLLSVGIVVVAYAVFVPVFWLLGGQRLGDLPVWLHGSIELVQGYADAMSIEDPQAWASYLIVVIAVVVTIVQLVRGRVSRLQLISALILVLAAVFFGVRAGFTRDDLGHETQTFGILVVVALLAGAAFVRFRWAAVVAAVCGVAAILASGYSLFPIADPVTMLTQERQSLTTLISPAFRQQLEDKSRSELRADYALSPAILHAVTGRTVHIDPYAANVAWAYRLDWKPVPVIQSYSAYTPYLDALDAAALASADGPQSVIRSTPDPIDHRNAMWDSPQYMTALVCHFATAAHSASWLVLDKTSNRCSGETKLTSQTFTPGQQIDVPQATDDHTMIVARVSLSTSPLDRVATALFKPLHSLQVTAASTSYRLPRGEAAGPLIVRMPADSDWPSTFGGDFDASRLSLNASGSVTFFAIDVS